MSAIEVKFGKSRQPDARDAVKELAAQTGAKEADALIFFCAPGYDLPALGKAIKSTFNCPAIGCTTAGEILSGEGYIEDSIVCAAIFSERLTMKPLFIENLRGFVDAPEEKLFKPLAQAKQGNSFSLFFIDGLSKLEEPMVGIINRLRPEIPLIGASAGDGLNFEHAYVYHDGAFHENAAVLALFETDLPFMPMRVQHFEPTSTRIVITEASVPDRTVIEINGLPAVEGYAEAVGLDINKLNPHVFATYPVMLKIGGEYYVRSIQKMNPDGSLVFFCAIDEGLVLTVAKHSVTLVGNLEAELARIHETIARPVLIFGSDCILRRLEMRQYGELDRAGEILSRYPFIGFSTYGEQIDGVHVNHTLTALVLGDEA